MPTCRDCGFVTSDRAAHESECRGPYVRSLDTPKWACFPDYCLLEMTQVCDRRRLACTLCGLSVPFALQVDGSETLEHYDHEGKREEPRPPLEPSEIVRLFECYAAFIQASARLKESAQRCADLEENARNDIVSNARLSYAQMEKTKDAHALESARSALREAVSAYRLTHPESVLRSLE